MYSNSSLTCPDYVCPVPGGHPLPWTRVKEEGAYYNHAMSDTAYVVPGFSEAQQDWHQWMELHQPNPKQNVYHGSLANNNVSQSLPDFLPPNYLQQAAVMISRPQLLSHSSSASPSSSASSTPSPCSFSPNTGYELTVGQYALMQPSIATQSFSPEYKHRRSSDIDTVGSERYPDIYTDYSPRYACSCPDHMTHLTHSTALPHTMTSMAPPQMPLKSVGEVRPYPCYVCNRSFARKHDLQRHLRVHTGDKPYVCLCCKKAFARTDALKRHLRMEESCRMSPEVQAMKCAGKRRYRNL